MAVDASSKPKVRDSEPRDSKRKKNTGTADEATECMISKGVPSTALRRTPIHIHIFCACINYTLYRSHTPGSIRFGYRDFSVRPSSHLAFLARGGSLASGSFAVNSEWASATISLQCRNFALNAGGTFSRRASNTPNALFQDI